MKQAYVQQPIRLLSMSVSTLFACSFALAQIDSNKVYLLLSTSGTETLQEEMDEAVPEGFRIVTTASRGGGQVVLMKRTAQKGEGFQYRVLGTTKVDTMEGELNQAAAAGYCLLRGTMLHRDRPFGPPELVAFMERASGSSNRCEYRVLGTSRTGTMEAEALALEEQGFTVVDMAQAGELAVVLERRQ